MFAYCLFCETVKCRFVAEMIATRTPYRVIYPKQVQHTWSKGKAVDIEHDLLPGYLFVYSEGEPANVADFRTIKGVIFCLCDSERNYELTGSDRDFAMMLLGQNGIIGKTQVYSEGQMIRIREGAYAGVQTRILKVDRRNMRMQIELAFAGREVKTWVEYELVEAEETGE